MDMIVYECAGRCSQDDMEFANEVRLADRM